MTTKDDEAAEDDEDCEKIGEDVEEDDTDTNLSDADDDLNVSSSEDKNGGDLPPRPPRPPPRHPPRPPRPPARRGLAPSPIPARLPLIRSLLPCLSSATPSTSATPAAAATAQPPAEGQQAQSDSGGSACCVSRRGRWSAAADHFPDERCAVTVGPAGLFSFLACSSARLCLLPTAHPACASDERHEGTVVAGPRSGCSSGV
ncbi:hypothetical protein CF327_g2808 [Tilletia walkeri]|uniref:Uncharacterized protein n=1 Tax=Tilletia walkeri TaxID=117179 RepID=A0A8X7T4R0_9BASI|nr:hypothetical protein CF327_g2808 [Tilletia walkeri]KAE8268078.1 hypothetical protein A4X09_0g4254 [Tilletia walkeri]